MKLQPHTQPIDVSNWKSNEPFNPYPVGARDKSLLISPNNSPYNFLRREHQYLYKHSSNRYPEQFWMEVFSFRFGKLLGLPIPPAHVAHDSDNDTCGALIEWFIHSGEKIGKGTSIKYVIVGNSILNPIRWAFYVYLRLILILSGNRKAYFERYTPGGDYLQRMIPDFDRKTGSQHNWGTVSKTCSILSRYANLDNKNWIQYWATTFVFDALIGNTDRHQDNWGIIWQLRDAKLFSARLTPIFDNGTSMGHEISPSNIIKFNNPAHIERYIRRGTHHMKWDIKDENKTSHIEFMKLFTSKYPDTMPIVDKLTSYSSGDLDAILNILCKFDIPVPLTQERAELMSKLVIARTRKLRESLNL